MKTFYGIQLGNYLQTLSPHKILKVNGMTKRKIGCLGENGKEHYYYLKDVFPIPLTDKILEDYKDLLEDYRQGKDGYFYIIPVDSGNLYQIKWFHEFQNIMLFHQHIIEWKEN